MHALASYAGGTYECVALHGNEMRLGMRRVRKALSLCRAERSVITDVFIEGYE